MKKLVLYSLIGFGTLLAQTPVHESESEQTAITHHGRKVQTDTTKSTTTVDQNGKLTTNSTQTQSTARKHHGKWKKTESSQSSSTSTPPQQ